METAIGVFSSASERKRQCKNSWENTSRKSQSFI